MTEQEIKNSIVLICLDLKDPRKDLSCIDAMNRIYTLFPKQEIIFPTDRQIKKEAKHISCEEYSSDEQMRYEEGRIDGANWMKEQVQQLNQ